MKKMNYPNRARLFKSCAVILLSLIAGAFHAAADTTDRPNIIFLLADDQRDDVLGSYGNTLIQTPTLDRLAAEGLRFENSFCEVPICAASRATILTGLSQRTHGYNFSERPVNKEHAETSYPVLLKQAGYRIGFAGKYGIKAVGRSLIREFDFFDNIGRNPYLKEMPDGSLRHETDLCVDAAIEFIGSNAEGTPFCMSISFNATHAEDKDRRPGYHFQWPESADGLYEDLEIPAPNLSDPKYYEALPAFMQDEKELSRQRYFWRWDTPEKYQTNMRAYYRMLTGIDNAVARLINVLQEKGLDKNTIIIYTADNGFMLGDRGLAGKWNHYEQSLRVPLIIYDPRLPASKRGRVVEELVNNIDIAPTLLDLAGVKIPDAYHGQSLVPFLKGQPENWRKDVYVEHIFNRYNDFQAVRSDRYKYAVYTDTPYEALYDLEKDPNELINLASNPEYAGVLEKMKARMDYYLAEFPDRNGKKKSK